MLIWKGYFLSIYLLIVVLELLGVNTYTTYTCSKKKKSKFVTLFSTFIISIAFSILLMPIANQIPNYVKGKGNGLFMLLGFLYIIPLKYLFDQPIKHLMIIMSSSWIYTMFVFAFSLRIGYLFPPELLWLSVLFIQTLIFALTLPFYIKGVNKIFLFILNNIENTMINSFLAISLSWFFIIFLLNYIFVEGNFILTELIILFVIIANTILSYKMVYNLVSVNNKANELREINQLDTLTQLRNREGLYNDAKRKIENGESFTFIFGDLDNFKLVNDNFGHDVGDKYLIEFVKAVKEMQNSNDTLYRLHGDEFVFLVHRHDVEAYCREIEKMKFINNLDGVDFKGISLGCSSFPTDGKNISELLYLADLRMYQVKKEKHKNKMK